MTQFLFLLSLVSLPTLRTCLPVAQPVGHVICPRYKCILTHRHTYTHIWMYACMFAYLAALAAWLDIAFLLPGEILARRVRVRGEPLRCAHTLPGLGLCLCLGLGLCISNACNKATFTTWLGNWPKAASQDTVRPGAVLSSRFWHILICKCNFSNELQHTLTHTHTHIQRDFVPGRAF